MADVKISALTAASAVAGANEFAINEAGVSKKVTATQIATFIGSSPLVKISAQTASASTEIAWTGLSGYAAYLLLLNLSMDSASSGDQFCLQLGTGAGPTYITSGYVTSYLSNTNGAPGGSGQAAGAQGNLARNNAYGGSAGSRYSADIWFTNFDNATPYDTGWHAHYIETQANSPTTDGGIAGGFAWGNTTAKTAIKIFTITSQAFSGVGTLYGVVT